MIELSKLRIGIIVQPYLDPTEGGGYTYHETLVEAINQHTFHPDIEIVNIVVYKERMPTMQSEKPSIYIRSTFSYRLKDKIKRIAPKRNSTTYTARNPVISFVYNILLKRQHRMIERRLAAEKIDLVYYLKPSYHVLNYPFISTHWDVAHRSMDAFPEVALNKNYEMRENYYVYSLNKAFLILCESEHGAAELKKFYSIYEKKIKVMPIFASNIINFKVSAARQEEILHQFGLKREKFFLYPAQFWACKNHYNLIMAFVQLTKEVNDPELKLILCGSDMGNAAYIQEVIETLNLSDRVLTPGFVSNEQLATFYKNAICLTMPTFLGPTNIPLMEAAHFKCAVLCSDFEGHREILGDTAIYCDPSDAGEIKSGMLQYLDPNIREKYRIKAHTHILNSEFLIARSMNKLNEILLEARAKRKVWGIDYFL